MISRKELDKHLGEAIEAVKRRDESWREDRITIDSVPDALFSCARAYQYLATTATLLGSSSQAKSWFAEAGTWHLESVRAYRCRRDITERAAWRSEPAALSRALSAALVSQDEAVIDAVAEGTLSMDESYLDVFGEGDPGSAAQYFDAKARAAIALDEDRAADLVSNLQHSVERLSEGSSYWDLAPRIYRGVLEDNQTTTQDAITDLHEFYADRNEKTDDPRKFVLLELVAFIVLARRRGVDVSIDSERVPEALVDERASNQDVVLDVDLDELEFTSDVGMFELECDEGRPFIAGRIYHPGGEPVTAEDVPEREAGRVLSDEWVEAALDEAEWREHYDDELVAEAREAYENGLLQRKLVVVQDRTDEHLFDESLTELPIDDVELLKGAGRPD